MNYHDGGTCQFRLFRRYERGDFLTQIRPSKFERHFVAELGLGGDAVSRNMPYERYCSLVSKVFRILDKSFGPTFIGYSTMS